MNDEGVRINKYLSELGICSRREAERWIEQGRVHVNRKVPTMGQRVLKKDEVRVDGRVVSKPAEPEIYIALNKPPGIVCTTDPTEPNNIVQFVNYPKRIFPIGRLDKPSEGLIFLTSDGDIVNKILRAGNNHEKEYEVQVDKAITDEFINKMINGVPILGTMTKKCKVIKIDSHRFRITLIQGMNRQIRRMCEYLGYNVMKLKRTRIMNVSLDIPQGDWRDLTSGELDTIMALTKASDKTSNKGSKSSSKSTPIGNPPKKSKPRFDPRNKPGSIARKKNTNNKSRKKRK